MAVSQAAAQSKPTMAAVIFLTALVRIPFAGVIGVCSDSHQDTNDRRKKHKEKPAPSPQINPV
jgi:hypothetical protein